MNAESSEKAVKTYSYYIPRGYYVQSQRMGEGREAPRVSDLKMGSGSESRTSQGKAHKGIDNNNTIEIIYKDS
ncbi:hypothetical protein FH972_009417 [Carpinus fangiana]|uniref:Uncharacterized protein n=1 Tax=Carpinus fangiana TaxID=176857 RepID=A0A5N6R1U6_9ROSI|nr:hypothetical protein FH972_009417 [Carpinus fangiana]